MSLESLLRKKYIFKVTTWTRNEKTLAPERSDSTIREIVKANMEYPVLRKKQDGSSHYVEVTDGFIKKTCLKLLLYEQLQRVVSFVYYKATVMYILIQ